MRLRLIPVLMFVLAATLTVKIGSVWSDISFEFGNQSIAQGMQPSPEVSGNAPPAGPAIPPAATGESQSDAGGQAGAATAMTGATDPGADQQASNQPTPADPFEYTDEEIEVLQQLAKRREELDLRARQVEEREALIKAAEQRMEQKMAELRALQATVEDLLQQRTEEEENQLKSLVKIYENMKPKDAAQVFAELDMDILLEVVGRMNERKAAPVLALMEPARAKEVTLELADRRSMPLPP